MSLSPLDWVTKFAKFAGVAADKLDLFTEKHPELIDEHHKDAPPPAPTGDVDPSVRDAIESGEV